MYVCTMARLHPAGLSWKAVSVSGKGQEDGKDVGKSSAQRLKAGPSAEVQCLLCPSQLKPADPTCVPAIFVRQHRQARPGWSYQFHLRGSLGRYQVVLVDAACDEQG